jgi:hypothetical protein
MHKALRILPLLFLPVLYAQQSAPQPPPNSDLDLRILEVRAMEEKEALEKSAGFVGTNILVRLRLENKSAAGILVLLVEDAIDPLSCIGKEKKTTKNCWSKLLGIPNRWLILPSGGALEWEETDAGAFKGETHYIGIMIKRQQEGPPQELVSPVYKVPVPLYEPKRDEHEH